MTIMAGHNDLKYAVYFNKNNPHITTHKIRCSHVDKHDRDHQYNQGGWGYFAEKYAAEQFTKAICQHKEIESNSCQHCGGL